MTEKTDAERIRELEATVARLERERTNTPDLEWLRNSHAWKRTEYWAHPRWHWAGAAMTVIMIAVFYFGSRFGEPDRGIHARRSDPGVVESYHYVDGKRVTSPSVETRHGDGS